MGLSIVPDETLASCHNPINKLIMHRLAFVSNTRSNYKLQSVFSNIITAATRILNAVGSVVAIKGLSIIF